MSLSKNQLKLITSLQQKKYRLKHNLFVAEGTKVVEEFLKSNFEVVQLFCIDASIYENVTNYILISENELQKISTLSSPNNVIAIFKIPVAENFKDEGLILVLDGINDPGNFGTIIRLCDWFGIKKLICSENTVDCYNSKVVQSSMGSLTRVSIIYTNIENFINNTDLPVFVTLMEGENIYKMDLPKQAVVVMGNEANGISETILNLKNIPISIPRFGNLQQTESLNVATATAIILSEFKRGN